MIEIPIIIGSCMCIYLFRELTRKKNRNPNISNETRNNILVFLDINGRIIRVERNTENIINSPETIDNNTETSICDNENIICTITQENIQIGTEIRTLPCNHIFNKEKIDIWLEQNNNCPICRKIIINN